MKSYLSLLDTVSREGEYRTERTGTGATSLFAPADFRHNLSEGFPLLTTKRVHFHSILHELIWFLSGSTNVRYLQENNVTIWDEWTNEHGELGRVYGAQWRDFGSLHSGKPGVDQIANLVEGLRKDPYGRRHLVTAWNPQDVPNCALPPCHYGFQCYVRRDGTLDLKMNMRSTDAFLGLPFNIASYALLLTVLANVLKLKAGRLTVSFGDLHIYRNHYQQVALQMTREPRALPQLRLARQLENPWDLTQDDVELSGYDPAPSIKAPVAV